MAQGIDILEQEEATELQRVYDLFFEGVDSLYMLIAHYSAILHIPTSQGKDSTIVKLMAIAAYERAISEGIISSNHPLIMSTVDTLGESIPMKMYVRYASRRLKKYAQEKGINLLYEVVTPPLNDEYFVRFVGGQK